MPNEGFLDLKGDADQLLALGRTIEAAVPRHSGVTLGVGIAPTTGIDEYSRVALPAPVAGRGFCAKGRDDGVGPLVNEWQKTEDGKKITNYPYSENEPLPGFAGLYEFRADPQIPEEDPGAPTWRERQPGRVAESSPAQRLVAFACLFIL